jgi:hypothetical protein
MFKNNLKKLSFILAVFCLSNAVYGANTIQKLEPTDKIQELVPPDPIQTLKPQAPKEKRDIPLTTDNSQSPSEQMVLPCNLISWKSCIFETHKCLKGKSTIDDCRSAFLTCNKNAQCEN